jgi:predicted DNA-binding transcriptional regulator AlpA
MTKFVRFRELPEYGVKYSRSHIQHLVKAGKFPAPIKLDGGHSAAIVWAEGDLIAYNQSILNRRRPVGA